MKTLALRAAEVSTARRTRTGCGINGLRCRGRQKLVPACALMPSSVSPLSPHAAPSQAAALPWPSAALNAVSSRLPSVPPELAAVALVYFVQGIMELATMAQTYHLKDELHADPAQVALFLSLAGIPWAVKPLIGFISDTVPLWGYKRRSYLLLASVAGTASYMWMARGPASAVGFLGAMLLCSTASAVSDVVVDSLVVERARGETQEAAGSLQSLCWASYAVAQVVTASLSGSLVQEYGPRTVFELTALFPLLVGGASVLLKEDRASSGSTSSTGSSSYGSNGSYGEHHGGSLGSDGHGSLGSSTGSYGSYGSDSSGARSYVTTGADAVTGEAKQLLTELGGQGASPATGPGVQAAAAAAGAGGGLPTQAAMAAHAAQLWEALKRPDVAAPLSFLLLLSATPSADSALFFYQTEELHFSASFLGQVQLAAACASFAGVILYNSYLKRVPVRSLMLWGTLLAATLQTSQLVLVSGAHRAWGIDDHCFVLGGSVVLDVVKNVLYMPTMVLAARLCPPGLEATMFATIMSLSNLADSVRMGGGAALMSALHVSPQDWSQLPTLLAVCNAGLLLPLTLLHRIPTDDAAAPGDAPAAINHAATPPAISHVAAPGNASSAINHANKEPVGAGPHATPSIMAECHAADIASTQGSSVVPPGRAAVTSSTAVYSKTQPAPASSPATHSLPTAPTSRTGLCKSNIDPYALAEASFVLEAVMVTRSASQETATGAEVASETAQVEAGVCQQRDSMSERVPAAAGGPGQGESGAGLGLPGLHWVGSEAGLNLLPLLGDATHHHHYTLHLQPPAAAVGADASHHSQGSEHQVPSGTQQGPATQGAEQLHTNQPDLDEYPSNAAGLLPSYALSPATSAGRQGAEHQAPSSTQAPSTQVAHQPNTKQPVLGEYPSNAACLHPLQSPSPATSPGSGIMEGFSARVVLTSAHQQPAGVTGVIIPLPNRLSVVHAKPAWGALDRTAKRKARAAAKRRWALRRWRRREGRRYSDGGLHAHSACMMEEECGWYRGGEEEPRQDMSVAAALLAESVLVTA